MRDHRRLHEKSRSFRGAYCNGPDGEADDSYSTARIIMMSFTPSTHLRTAATWLRSLRPRVADGILSLDVLGAAPARLLMDDMPELLEKSASVLRRSPLPSSFLEWPAALSRLDGGRFLRTVPQLGLTALLFSAFMAMILAVCQRSPNKRRTFWLSRMLLVRGMALIYLAAFSTSAAQSRALFGSIGLDPALSRPSGRPTPAFDLVGRTDLALEAVSWLGVLLSLLVAGGVVQWAGAQLLLWIGYLSIVNLAPRVVIGYGWEWATCEVRA